MAFFLDVVKEGRRWYVDDDNGFSHDENELVSGIPEMIRALVGTATRARLDIRTEPFEGAATLTLTDPDSYDGVEYSMSTSGKTIVGWLCPVFWHYLPAAPEKLYVGVVKVA